MKIFFILQLISAGIISAHWFIPADFSSLQIYLDFHTEGADQVALKKDYEKCRAEFSKKDGEFSSEAPESLDVRIDDGAMSLEAGKPLYIEPWPDAKVPTVLDENFTQEERRRLACATLFFKANTCIMFIQAREKHTHNLTITRKTSNRLPPCYSTAIGRGTGTNQAVNLDPTSERCWKHGTIVHELAHALGFLHQQQRDDRGNHIQVHWENIPEKYHSQFKTARDLGFVQLEGGEYDFGSIMQYGRFQVSRTKPSMTAKGNSAVQQIAHEQMGNRNTPSDSDTKKLNDMYCAAKTTSTSTRSTTKRTTSTPPTTTFSTTEFESSTAQDSECPLLEAREMCVCRVANRYWGDATKQMRALRSELEIEFGGEWGVIIVKKAAQGTVHLSIPTRTYTSGTQAFCVTKYGSWTYVVFLTHCVKNRRGRQQRQTSIFDHPFFSEPFSIFSKESSEENKNCPLLDAKELCVCEAARKYEGQPDEQMEFMRERLTEEYGGEWGAMIVEDKELVGDTVLWNFPTRTFKSGTPAFCITDNEGWMYDLFLTRC